MERSEIEQAEENLRVIRGLMERATVYRAISAPTALVGGILGTILAYLQWSTPGGAGSKAASAHFWRGELDLRGFVSAWLVVLALSLLANTIFIWRKACRENGTLISSGLRLAMSCALPCVLVAGVITEIAWQDNGSEQASLAVVAAWIIFYGLALLATRTFAPRSLVALGWAFLVSGIVALVIALRLLDPVVDQPAAALMGGTFGFFHLIYAATAWPRRSAAA